MGWFIGKFEGWASGKMRADLLAFTSTLRSMTERELGIVVAAATQARHLLESLGHSPLDPIAYVAMNPRFPRLLERFIRELRKNERIYDTAGMMVWAHTARAGMRPALRQPARDMWRELSRGFAHVESGCRALEQMNGVRLSPEGAGKFPKGFAPDPALAALIIAKAQLAARRTLSDEE